MLLSNDSAGHVITRLFSLIFCHPTRIASEIGGMRDNGSKRNVALIIETSSAYGRNLLSGIVKYMRMREHWSVFLEQRDVWGKPPSWLSSWTGDGIISRATTPQLLQAVSKTGVPLVEVTDRKNAPHSPQIRSNDEVIGRMGAEHLVERGFEHFAFCGFDDEMWSERRADGFAKAIQDLTGSQCFRYSSSWKIPTSRTWDQEKQRLANWITSLPKPIGIMACNDERGLQLLDLCAQLDVAVPESAAVLGVDNDELLCRFSSPPMSSVIPNASLVGYRAAERLDQIMNGSLDGPSLETIEPVGIADRLSTDIVAVDDPHVASSLRYIRENACKGISVDDVVKNNPLSRSTLERQIRKYLGRTPQEEIRNVQIKKARELLLTTDLPIEQIAHLCGFEQPEYMYVVFKRTTGETPGEFRRRSHH